MYKARLTSYKCIIYGLSGHSQSYYYDYIGLECCFSDTEPRRGSSWTGTRPIYIQTPYRNDPGLANEPTIIMRHNYFMIVSLLFMFVCLIFGNKSVIIL